MRQKYQELMAEPEKIEAILQAGGHKATALSAPYMRKLRNAVGLRPLVASKTTASSHKATKTPAPSFKQYREADGQFYFKLVSSSGQMLLQSHGFASPQDAAKAVAVLKQNGADALAVMKDQISLAEGIELSDVGVALALLNQP